MQITTKTLLDAMKQLDYPVFKGDWNLNLIGIRSNDRDANTFNDVLVVLFQIGNKWHMYCFNCTTDPGDDYRLTPINVDGVAQLVPGHYSSCWKIGVHRGQYHALVQAGEMTVYRDNDGNEKLDQIDVMQSGIYGINLHRANPNRLSVLVDKWSAGCQVVADPIDFNLLMALVKKSAQTYGDRLSYTLLTEEQLS